MQSSDKDFFKERYYFREKQSVKDLLSAYEEWEAHFRYAK